MPGVTLFQLRICRCKIDLDSVFNCGTPVRTSNNSYLQPALEFSRVVDAICLYCIVVIPKCAYFYLLGYPVVLTVSASLLHRFEIGVAIDIFC